MIYYEAIKPLALYKAHKIKKVEVICKEPAFCDSPWIRVITEEGRYFYTGGYAEISGLLSAGRKKAICAGANG